MKFYQLSFRTTREKNLIAKIEEKAKAEEKTIKEIMLKALNFYMSVAKDKNFNEDEVLHKYLKQNL